MKKGNIFALAFALSVIIFVMLRGGVQEETHDHTESNISIHHSSDNRDDDIRADERQEEMTDEEEVIVSITNIGIVREPEPVPDPEAEAVPESEVTEDEEERRPAGEAAGSDDVSGDADSVQPDSVGTDSTAEVAEQPALEEDKDDDIRVDSGSGIGTDMVETAGDQRDTEGLDVWDLGYQKWGISYEDTTRILKLITYEGYGWSELSYYVACACWVRVTEGYWGYGNIYSAFGEIDTQYGTWMDELGYEDYAVYMLEACYREPTYCRYCNGCMVPDEWIYAEGGIYCWN